MDGSMQKENNHYKGIIMEAPEKIYLYPSDRPGEEYEEEWGDKPWGENNVEYTRTDTFIEKALAWIEEHGEFIETEDNSTTRQIPDYFVENFKSYMKGE